MITTRPTRARWVIAFAALLTAATALAAAPASASPDDTPVSVIVRETADAADEAEGYVTAHGGSVGNRLSIIDSFEASLPAYAVADLEALPSVVAVTPNAAVQLLDWDTTPGQTRNTMDRIANDVLSADKFWNEGAHGQGVDIALIDSGVVPVEGLTIAGKIVNGPDLSFESQADNLRYLDTYGHGTHLAGIMAGNDGNSSSITTQSVKKGFLGIAPKARVVSIKVPMPTATPTSPRS